MKQTLIKLLRSSAENVTFSQLLAQVEAELGRGMFTTPDVRKALYKMVDDRMVIRTMDDDIQAYRYRWNRHSFMNEEA